MKLFPTGVPNLDSVLGGGVPMYSLNILAGQPGTGKTILVQQILFSSLKADSGNRALYLTTLSEPTVKVVRYMQQFGFFDGEHFGDRMLFQDIGPVIRQQPLSEVIEHILRLVEAHRPQLLAIDSFKAIRDMSPSIGDFRRFCYDLSVRLASARCTAFLVGEYDRPEIADGAEFAVADGIVYLDIADQEGDRSRFIQVYKMRGRAIEMSPYPFMISSDGIRILSPALTLQRRQSGLEVESQRLNTGIPGRDDLLRGGIPRGRSLLLSGVSGTGKTTLALQFLYHGALNGQRGMIFSFEETTDRLRRNALGFGWDLQALEEKGLLRIIFIPQTDIHVEEHLEMMAQQVAEFQPHRFVIDSFSVFLHKITSPTTQREKSFQLATLVQRAGAVGILISDIPAGEPNRLSRFGVEETVVDGVVVLSTAADSTQRKRYIEVYKMRAAEHVQGRYRMEIGPRGIDILYVVNREIDTSVAPPHLIFGPVESLIQGDVGYGSSWLIQGDPGIGKSTMAYQFALDGLRRKESVLYVSVDTPSEQIRLTLQDFGFLADPYLESGQLGIVDSFQPGYDINDTEILLFAVIRQMERMPRPLRLITDSLTPLALDRSPSDFVKLVYRKNRMLHRPDVAIFDTLLRGVLADSDLHRLVGAFDIVNELYIPDWGEMKLAGNVGYRTLRIEKSRGNRIDPRPYPYTISPTDGLVVQKDHYRGQVGRFY